MRYSVRGVWNTERDRAIAEELCHPDYSVRRRGRGPRNGPREWQSIPQSRAATLTYYFTPKTPQYCSGVTSYLTAKGERRYYKYQYQPMTYFEMVGRDEATGKPRVRHLPNNRGEYDRERISESPQIRSREEIEAYIERLNTDWQADIIEIDPAEYRGNDYGED